MTTSSPTRLVRVAKLFNGVVLFFLAAGWLVPILAGVIDLLVRIANNFGYDGDLIITDWDKAGMLALCFVIFFPLYRFFQRLGKIIDSVTEQNVFSIDNAKNLQAMGWYLLASQVAVTLATAWNFTWIESSDHDAIRDNWIELALSFPYYILVVVLFILAGAFRHGTAMRDDLEGTV